MRHMTECLINGLFHHLVLNHNEVGTPSVVGMCEVKPQGVSFTRTRVRANNKFQSGEYGGQLSFPHQFCRRQSGGHLIFQN
jgi:hypothetical protein